MIQPRQRALIDSIMSHVSNATRLTSRSWPFAHWLAALVAGAVLITGLSISTISQNTVATHSHQVFHEYLQQTLRRLSVALAPSVLDNDRVSLNVILNDWQTDAQIPHIRVYNAEHELIAQTGSKHDELPSESQRIIHDQTWVGVLEVSVDHSTIDHVLWAHLAINLLISALASVLLGALAWALGRRYQRHLHALCKDIDSLSTRTTIDTVRESNASAPSKHKQTQHTLTSEPSFIWCEQLNALQRSTDEQLSHAQQTAHLNHCVALCQPSFPQPSVQTDTQNKATSLAVFMWPTDQDLPELLEHLGTVAKLYQATLVLCAPNAIGLAFEGDEDDISSNGNDSSHPNPNALYAACLIQALMAQRTTAVVTHRNASLGAIEHPLARYQLSADGLNNLWPLFDTAQDCAETGIAAAPTALWACGAVKNAHERAHPDAAWQNQTTVLSEENHIWHLQHLDDSDTLLIERQQTQLRRLAASSTPS